WLPPDHPALAENRGNSCQRRHPAEILALGPSCASLRRSSNANSLCRQIWLDSLEIYATFQRDILRTFLSSSPPTPATQSGLCGAFIPFMGFASSAVHFNGRACRAERAD